MKPDQVREQDRKTNGICQLLGIKEQQIRLITLKQAYEAADKGIHIGGCWSAAIPMTTLF